MVRKRDDDVLLESNGIGGSETVVNDKKTMTPKWRRIIIRMDEEEDYDDEIKIEKCVEQAYRPSGLQTHQEERTPILMDGLTQEHHVGNPCQNEVQSTELQSNWQVVESVKDEDEDVKAQQSAEEIQHPLATASSDQKGPTVTASGVVDANYQKSQIIGNAQVDDANGGPTIGGTTEEITAQLAPYLVKPGIFQASPLVKNDAQGVEHKTIPVPFQFACLYCRIHGIVNGSSNIKKARKHRSRCPYNPHRSPHMVVITKKTPDTTPKKNKHPRPPRRPWLLPDRTIYWLRLGQKKWTCRQCQEHQEPEKFWQSKAWVRRHWMSCAYNPNIGFHVPYALKRRKGKTRKVSLKRFLSLID